jgi:hypothetical protein
MTHPITKAALAVPLTRPLALADSAIAKATPVCGGSGTQGSR